MLTGSFDWVLSRQCRSWDPLFWRFWVILSKYTLPYEEVSLRSSHFQEHLLYLVVIFVKLWLANKWCWVKNFANIIYKWPNRTSFQSRSYLFFKIQSLITLKAQRLKMACHLPSSHINSCLKKKKISRNFPRNLGNVS